MRIPRAESWDVGVDHSHGNPNSSFYFPSRRGLWAVCTVSRAMEPEEGVGLKVEKGGTGVETAWAKPAEPERSRLLGLPRD